ncbi:hypothetical protein EJV47_03005 [Hymenobacter gummosus]|uniref:Uncharacterized protein n=1 Tax=Hymenobacter gummosus TaxID=1776032 RepID=A0A3S0K975_9BACT|nr:hypothetical protein [Hymenobacter gummosus]RTQ53720.1 hypothetical protein EJV47_03005 [Hymenobacter gummosus]
MKRFFARPFAALTLVGLLSASLLTSCLDKDGEECTPAGGTCDTAVTVVDLSATTGCGLALQLADSTYLVPTGSTWTNYQAKAGDKLLVGYHAKKRGSSQNTCAAGQLVELGCISADTTAATSAN